MRTLLLTLICAAALAWLSCAGAPAPPPEPELVEYPLEIEHAVEPMPVFTLHQVGDDLSEGVSVLDLNADGRADIASGAYWYEAPSWTRRKFREALVEGEYVVNCGEAAIDVDEDGDLDIVSAGWQEDGLFWYENPGTVGPQWEKHRIGDSLHTEGLWRVDLDGDGKDEFLAVHYTASEVVYVTFAGGEAKMVRIGGEEGDEHGVGAGDLDGDGKIDVVTTKGWYRQQTPTEWEWRPDFELGDVGFGIQVYDVNDDGRNDLIYGRGHSYGLFWLEQTAEGGWRNHLIDGSYSQLHNVALADLNGDGQPELVTGKRYRGHNGDDPGGYEPQAIFYYVINRETASFERYPIAYNSGAGVGTQFVFTDLDGDSDIDIVTAGKGGQYWFENLSVDNVPREEREKQLLINPEWPFED